MKEKIKQLIQLQDYDNKIKEVMKKKSDGPLKIQKLKEELDWLEMKFREESQKLDSLRKENRELDRAIQDIENKVKKSNIKLTSIKSNKEYTAALKEIEDLKKNKLMTEDKALELMEMTEEIEQRCLESKKKWTKIKKKFEEDKHEIEEEDIKLDAELESLETEKAKCLQATDQEMLKKYLFLMERKSGLAISSVIKGVCQACHMGIPPQKFNELIKGNTLLTCPYCHRIIFWGEETHYQEVLNNVGLS